MGRRKRRGDAGTGVRGFFRTAGGERRDFVGRRYVEPVPGGYDFRLRYELLLFDARGNAVGEAHWSDEKLSREVVCYRVEE